MNQLNFYLVAVDQRQLRLLSQWSRPGTKRDSTGSLQAYKQLHRFMRYFCFL